ncbi:hypothetical protein Zmor_005737 [Zophobas morio]|uniref:Tyr recombinase domain-containing protein n=1 Tax=Zophobas morio TaxID=2755281 RepID=A0AA38ITT3_9CUCU|nr:hypothetical protein Zmor_005737 [Zophobas morio]
MLEGEPSCTPPEIKETALRMEEQLLPEKSKKLYLKIYSEFKDWCLGKKIGTTSENVLMVYFNEQAKTKKASILWATYSMLKSTISLKENIRIENYPRLMSFLKRQNAGYKPKKSFVFSQEEITRFLTEAPDKDFLSKKVICVMGVAGACRTDELCNMKMKDIIVKEDIIIVNIPTSKNGASRKFVVIEPLWTEIIRKYTSKRPTPDMPKLLIGFRGDKPTRQNIGHNTISKTPNTIAKFLGLKNPDQYTGHSFRRTSATILAEKGIDLLSLKRHGGWKSSSVAEGYIDDSISNKKKIAEMVQSSFTTHSLPPTSVSFPSTSVSFPSTSVSFPSTSRGPEHEILNSTIDIPAASFSNSSTNTGTAGINMTCHNCSINYYFNKN